MKKELKKGQKKTEKPPSLQRVIDDTFSSMTKRFQESNKKLMIGDAVLGRMRGYPPWPARIRSFTKDKKSVGCYFYGTNNNGPVNVSKIVPIEDTHEVIRLIAIRNPYNFKKGVRELELELGIPENMSSLKEQLSIQ